MINKIVENYEQALAGLTDGMTVLISGFGDSGVPNALVEAVLDTNARDLFVVSNNAGAGEAGLARLFVERRIRKLLASFPRTLTANNPFEPQWREGKVELELVPQGIISERMRCAGAGLGGFFSPVGADTDLADGKETRVINGRKFVFEHPLKGDFALIGAHKADRWGNTIYRLAQRNFGPVMAMAADVVVMEVREIVELGALDPETIVTPGVFVDRVVLKRELKR